MDIRVSTNINDNFTHGLSEALNIIDQINKSSDEEDVLVFQDGVFVTPLFILPLLVYVNGCSKNIKYSYNNGYLDTIKFGLGGVKPDELGIEAFHNMLAKCNSKTYIPIISFLASKEYAEERSEILSAVENLLSRQVGLGLNIIMGLKYLIEENVDNIIEHSESERGYIFSQSYSGKEYMDLCIADNGISLLGSYLKIGADYIDDHLSAMKAANSGESTKNLPDAENRGYGIYTSKKMLVNGLSGNFVMLSGNALYLKSQKVDQIYTLPDIATWKGTIVAMRIPYVNRGFNYINFVE